MITSGVIFIRKAPYHAMDYKDEERDADSWGTADEAPLCTIDRLETSR
jgi:hypothetical protein